MKDAEISVNYSTLTPEAIVSSVLSHYAIGTVQRCQFWNRGLSDVYLVNTKTSSYVLRISHFHWRSKVDIDFELELLKFLQQQQISVAYPLETKAGKLSVEIDAPEGKRYGALFIYAPGEVAIGDLNQKQSWRLGETLAKLHNATVDFQPQWERQPLNLKYLLDHSIEAIAPHLQHRKDDYQYLTTLSTKIKQQLQNLPTEPPYWVVCWGDPHSGNAHFTPEGEITLFDFDQCGYGWRAFDLAKFWHISLSTGISKQVREAFLAGYQSVETITDQELDLLQPLTQTAHIWVWAINLTASQIHGYSRIDNTYWQRRLEQLKRFSSPEWQLF